MKIIKVLILLVLIVVIWGCAAPPILDLKSNFAPPVKYCIDPIGHINGAKPWILGGTCCCTPTVSMYEIYKKEGTVKADVSYGDFLNLFKKRGIVTDLDPGYKGSNNRDDHGPHVVFGGRSMVTPTPATDNYEEVISGIKRTFKTN